MGIKKLFEGRLMVITVSHGQVDNKCGVFGLWHLCVFSEVVREFIKSGGEDRWLSECQGQNSSFSVSESKISRGFKQQRETPRLLLLLPTASFLSGLFSDQIQDTTKLLD